MSACDHPFVTSKTETVWENCAGVMRATGLRMWFECGKCGQRKGFEHLSFLTADEYNRNRAV